MSSCAMIYGRTLVGSNIYNVFPNPIQIHTILGTNWCKGSWEPTHLNKGSSEPTGVKVHGKLCGTIVGIELVINGLRVQAPKQIDGMTSFYKFTV